MSKLTDNLMVQLYLSFTQDYRSMSQQCFSPEMIRGEMHQRLGDSFGNRASSLSLLDDSEKIKTREFLDIFLESCQAFRDIPMSQRRQFFQQPPAPAPVHVYITAHQPHYYCASDDILFNWLLWNSFRSRYQAYSSPLPYERNSHHRERQESQTSSKGSSGDTLAALILVALVVLAALSALVALFYLVDQILNNIDRFIYDEGWLQATISLASMLGGLAVGGLLGTIFGFVPFLGLGLMAGFTSPVGVAIFGVICISIIGSAVTCGLTNWIQQKFIEKANPEALDPKNPYTFALTNAQEWDLFAHGIDPLKVKCAIIALREHMEINAKEAGPSRTSWLFTDRRNHDLKVIRQLKRGALHEVTVGDLYFDLRIYGYTPTPVPAYSAVPPTPMPHPYSDAIPSQSPFFRPATQPVVDMRGYPGTGTSSLVGQIPMPTEPHYDGFFPSAPPYPAAPVDTAPSAPPGLYGF